MGAAGITILAPSYPIVGYLEERNQKISNNISLDDPNFVYYHDGGDVTIVGLVMYALGIGLVFISFFTAIGYVLIRHGPKLKLKGADPD